HATIKDNINSKDNGDDNNTSDISWAVALRLAADHMFALESLTVRIKDDHLPQVVAAVCQVIANNGKTLRSIEMDDDTQIPPEIAWSMANHCSRLEKVPWISNDCYQ